MEYKDYRKLVNEISGESHLRCFVRWHAVKKLWLRSWSIHLPPSLATDLNSKH